MTPLGTERENLSSTTANSTPFRRTATAHSGLEGPGPSVPSPPGCLRTSRPRSTERAPAASRGGSEAGRRTRRDVFHIGSVTRCGVCEESVWSEAQQLCTTHTYTHVHTHTHTYTHSTHQPMFSDNECGARWGVRLGTHSPRRAGCDRLDSNAATQSCKQTH